MLTHIVSFKYKASTTEESRADHRARLRSLSSVDGVISLAVGADVIHAPDAVLPEWAQAGHEGMREPGV